MACATTTLLHLFGDRWSLSILHILQAGPSRHQGLVRSLPGISTRTLSERLKLLENLHLISRVIYPEVPPRVEYALTERGRGLEAVFTAIARASPTVLPSRSAARVQRALGTVACPACSGGRPLRRRRLIPKIARPVAPPFPTPRGEVRPYIPPAARQDITLL